MSGHQISFSFSVFSDHQLRSRTGQGTMAVPLNFRDFSYSVLV